MQSKKKFVAVGGDHSVTLPILRALHKHHKSKLAFIHFDAHLDTYPAAWGCEYHHGSFARHAIEEGLVDPTKMLQIDIRGPLADGSDLDFIKKSGKETSVGNKVFTNVSRYEGGLLQKKLDIPSRVIYMIRKMYSPEELPMDESFYQEWARRFPLMVVSEVKS